MPRYLSQQEPSARQPAARLTGVREEIKYLVPAVHGPALREALAFHIPPKLHSGSPFSLRASIYLDTLDKELSRGALERGSQTTKLRVKEYYNLLQGRPASDGNCFLEVKARYGAMVEKSRFLVPRVQVKDILERGPTLSRDPEEKAEQEAFEEVRAGRSLSPVLVVHYRRYTFQSPDSRTRVTLDDQLSFHVPPAGLFGERFALTSRDRLPPPIAVESAWVLEVKRLGLAPPWLAELVACATETDYSKFAFGVGALAERGLLLPAAPNASKPHGEKEP